MGKINVISNVCYLAVSNRLSTGGRGGPADHVVYISSPQDKGVDSQASSGIQIYLRIHLIEEEIRRLLMLGVQISSDLAFTARIEEVGLTLRTFRRRSKFLMLTVWKFLIPSKLDMLDMPSM